MKQISMAIAFILSLYFLWPSSEKPKENDESPIVDETTEVESVIEPEPPQPELTPPPQPKPKKIDRTNTPRRRITVQIGKAKNEDLPARKIKIKYGHVLFEIKMKNWAVAYGDILLGKLPEGTKVKMAQFKPPKPFLWPSGEIPYYIDKNLPNPERVEEVIRYLSEYTPIQLFQAKGGDEDGIAFVPGDEHCYSYLGKVGGFQPIFLSGACQFSEILHEIMHALGFVHEQSRTDRDNYVKILWQNIDPTKHLQFFKVPQDLMEASDLLPFDYNSIMLYEPNAFAIDGRLSMESLSHQKIEPSREGLSDNDIERIYQAYR